MFHTIEFRGQATLDLELTPSHCLKQFVIRNGARLRSKIKPYVDETESGPIEVADLEFEDGTITRKVPFECFSFVE